MSILALIIAIVVVGLILWVINSFIPMEPRIKQILNIVVIVLLVIWILKALGVFALLSGYRV